MVDVDGVCFSVR